MDVADSTRRPEKCNRPAVAVARRDLQSYVRGGTRTWRWLVASLTIDSGAMTGTRRDVSRDVLVIGRDKGCDLVFTEDTVSRKHARIVRGADGYYLEDLQSRNGTFLNGRKLNGPVRLRDGDNVHLYDVALTFCEGRPAPVKPPAGGGSGVWLSQETIVTGGTSARVGATVEIDLADRSGSLVNDRSDIQLQAVLDVTRHLRSCLDLPELYERILDSVRQIFPQLELACVLRLDPDGGRLVLDAVRSYTGSDPGTAGPIMQSIVRRALADGKAILSVDVAAELQAAGSSSVHEMDQRCVMCSPLLDSLRNPVGALYLDTTHVQQPFGSDDLDVLACVALLTSQAVEQATLHNARYRAAVNVSMDAIITFDADGRIESFNPAAIDLFGFDSGEMRTVNIREIAPHLGPLVVRADAEEAAAVLWKFQRSSESIGRRADGSTFPVRLSVGELRMGSHRLYTASVHDITEQRRVEQSLKRSNDELEREVEQRSNFVLLQQVVATIANEAESVALAFQAALDRIRETTHWRVGHVYLREEGDPAVFIDADIWSGAEESELAALRAATSERRIGEDIARCPAGRVISSRRACRAVGAAALAHDPRVQLLGELDLQNVHAFPVFVGDDVVAVMEFFAPSAEEPAEGLMNVMTHVGMQLGRVIERRRLQKELVDAVWDQQRGFGQELHDTIGQELAGIGMLADSLARKLAARDADESRTMRELTEMLQHAKQGVRTLAKGLLPVEVDADGLKAALEELAETTEDRCGITVDVWCDERLQLADNMVATHLFRIAQEAMTNAVRHAAANHLALRFARNADGEIELSVSDDGTGMPLGGRRPGQGVGLQIMKYRAQAIDADFEIHPGIGGGTVVACRLRRSNSHVSEPGRRPLQCAHR